MKSWVKKTLSDYRGTPSFKRQLSLLLALLLWRAIEVQAPEQVIFSVCGLIAAIITNTAWEGIYSRTKKNPEP